MKAARDKADAAINAVTATSEQIAQSIGAAIGISVVALLLAAAAIILSIRGRRPAAAASNA